MTKTAIVQFNDINNSSIKALAEKLQWKVDWYIFDETADREFELKEICEHYDEVYECIDVNKFKGVKAKINENDI